MTVSYVHKDVDALTLTVSTDLATSPARAWQLWADPRQLERWWGPPTYPATFTQHELTPGSLVHYRMTGPGGDEARGWWRILAVDEPALLEFDNGIFDHDARPGVEFPATHMRVTLVPENVGTRMTIFTTYPSLAAMEQMLAMGMEEGLVAAMGQIDGILAGAARG